MVDLFEGFNSFFQNKFMIYKWLIAGADLFSYAQVHAMVGEINALAA